MSIEQLLELVPEAHRDMGIFKEAENVDTVFERINELNAHRGQSIRIPSDNASADDFAAFDAKLQDKVPGLVRMPGDDSSDEAKAGFYGQLGRPTEASGYRLPETPDGFEPNPEAFNALGKFAFDNNMSQKQFESLVASEVSKSSAANLEVENFKTATTQALKEQWGSAYENRSRMVKGYLDQIFPHKKDEPLSALDAETVLAVEKLAIAAMEEGGSSLDFGDAGTGAGAGITPAEANNQIQEIYNNQAHPYHDPKSVGYNEAQKTMRKLMLAKQGKK